MRAGDETPARRRRATLRRWLGRDRAALAASGLLIADGVAGLGFAYALAVLVAGLGGPGRRIGLAAAVCGALLMTRGVLAEASVVMGARSAARARQAVRVRLSGALLRQPPDGPAGAMASLVCDAVDALEGYAARYRPAQVAARWVPVLIGLGMAAASWVSALIVFATLVPFGALMALAGGAAAEESHRQLTALTRLSGMFADRLRHLPTILAFTAEDRETAVLAAAAEELRRRTMAVLRIAFVSTGGLEFFAALSVALVAVYAGFDLLHALPFRAPETLTLQRAFFVLAAAPEFYAPLRRLAAAYHDRQAAETAVARLMSVMPDEDPPEAAPPPAWRAPPELRLEGLTIVYAGAAAPAVAGLDLTVPAGRIGVLVGPSGCGKTSVLRALLGMAPVSGGRIVVDGMARDSLAGAVGWLGQTTLLVPGTLAENLVLGLGARGVSAAELRAVAEAAGLGAVLDGRAGGLEMMIDERGSGLSGGERRRIGLARALLAGRHLLLLDEPTAHLDAASAALVIAAIRHAAGTRTVLMATHDAALAAIAEVGLVLAPGGSQALVV